MISQRQAILMIEDELPAVELKHLQSKHLYEFMQSYASRISTLGENGELKKFETQLIVADRFYREGCDEVREAMEKIFISTVSHSLERKPELLAIAKKNLSKFLLKVMRNDQLASNP